MNRNTFLKTALGSAAALSLPAAAQFIDYQQVTSPVIGGVKSRFAFGGQFNFGEVTLYQHLPGQEMGNFWESLRGDIKGPDRQIHLRADLCQQNIFRRVNCLAEEPDGKVIILSWGIASYEEVLKLAEIVKRLPNVTAVCATTSREYKMKLFADNVIDFSAHKDGLASHKCELIKRRRINLDGTIKQFSQAADGEFYNVGVTEQI